MKPDVKSALINSLLASLYVTVVATLMYFMGQNHIGNNNTILVPIVMILLFLLSAAITSWLIFGKPAQLFLEGKKKEAISMVGYTIGFLAAITFIDLILLIILGR
jgi:hypothetical protein